jgi:hypothetical protein
MTRKKDQTAWRDVADAVQYIRREVPGSTPSESPFSASRTAVFLAQAALTENPELFAAGISVAGIADLEILFGKNTVPWRRKFYEAEYGALEPERGLLKSLSPIHRIDRFRAPLLLIQRPERFPGAGFRGRAPGASASERGQSVELVCMTTRVIGCASRKTSRTLTGKWRTFSTGA